MIPGRFTIEGPVSAPVLVLANSLGTTSGLWAPQLPELRQRFRVVRYEHPGHGGADAPPGPYRIDGMADALVDALTDLGIARFSMCGESLGAMVAMAVARHHPDRIERLVLASATAHLPPAAGWTARAATVRSEPGGATALLDTLLPRWFTPTGAARPDLRLALAAMLDSTLAEGYAGCCEAIGAMDQRRDLASIHAPALVISGALDEVTPPAEGLALQAALPGASLVVLPDAAHLANLEQPVAFTAAMVDHLLGPVVERGERTRRDVLGDAHVDASHHEADHFSEPFVDLITRYAWGDIWTRPGLDRRTRSMLTVALLTALGRSEELALHVRAALANGVTRSELSEVLLHAAVYCGVPAANRAFAVADRTLRDLAPGGVPSEAQDGGDG